MIPDTETTLLRGGKMYEEGNEKSVKPGFGGDNTDGCAGSAGSKTAGGTDGDKAPAAVEKTEANEEGTEKPYDGVTITMMMNQGTYAKLHLAAFFWKFVRKSKKKQALPWIFSR